MFQKNTKIGFTVLQWKMWLLATLVIFLLFVVRVEWDYIGKKRCRCYLLDILKPSERNSFLANEFIGHDRMGDRKWGCKTPTEILVLGVLKVVRRLLYPGFRWVDYTAPHQEDEKRPPSSHNWISHQVARGCINPRGCFVTSRRSLIDSHAY